MVNVRLSAGLVTSLLNNRDFLKRFPEFMAVRSMATAPEKKRGCTKCQKNARGRRTLLAFYSVVRSLQQPKLQAFKLRLKADTITFQMQRVIAGKMRSEIIKL